MANENGPKDVLNWKSFGIFFKTILDLFTLIRTLYTEMGVGIEIIPWLVGDGRQTFLEKLQQLGRVYKNEQNDAVSKVMASLKTPSRDNSPLFGWPISVWEECNPEKLAYMVVQHIEPEVKTSPNDIVGITRVLVAALTVIRQRVVFKTPIRAAGLNSFEHYLAEQLTSLGCKREDIGVIANGAVYTSGFRRNLKG